MIRRNDSGAALLAENQAFLDTKPQISAFLARYATLLEKTDKINYAARCEKDGKTLLAMKVEPYHLQLFGDADCAGELLDFLVQAGYQRAEQVEGIGQFAARGGIVDFYPPQYSWPIRLEYWGDEVDSIAAFSLESQRREDSMKLVEITHVQEQLSRPAELAAHCMEDIDKTFVPRAKAGDIMVGGENFGCGSSREHAPVAIKAAGIDCVIAKSFARIFYRNAINIGLPILECPAASEAINEGDVVAINFDTGVITDETTGQTFQAAPFPPFIQKIIKAGGLMKSIQEGK